MSGCLVGPGFIGAVVPGPGYRLAAVVRTGAHTAGLVVVERSIRSMRQSICCAGGTQVHRRTWSGLRVVVGSIVDNVGARSEYESEAADLEPDGALRPKSPVGRSGYVSPTLGRNAVTSGFA